MGHLAELRSLHAQCWAAITFLFERGFLPAGREEGEQGLDAALTLQNLRAMRMAHRDIQGWGHQLPLADRQALDAAVVAATGTSLFATTPRSAALVAGVVKRGRIRNEREYHLVRARFDEIEGRGEHAAEAAELQALLAAF